MLGGETIALRAHRLDIEADKFALLAIVVAIK
jgi:hypothetical protein